MFLFLFVLLVVVEPRPRGAGKEFRGVEAGGKKCQCWQLNLLTQLPGAPIKAVIMRPSKRH